jgi:cytosine/adenosine deaminase-related metal-dependent hydrolase
VRASALFVFIAAMAGVVCAAEPPAAGVVISGARVIDVRTGEARDSDILVRDGRIVSVTTKGTQRPPAAAQVIDASGRYAIPGLWDMHLHLTAVPEMDADRLLTLLLANGVTSVRDTGGPIDAVLAMRKRANDETSAAPRVYVAGAVIDGFPTVHQGGQSAPGGSVTAATPDEAVRFVDTYADRGVDFIKAYEMLRPEVLNALVKRAHERNLLVTGHVPIRMTTLEALDAGLDGIEHIRGMEFDCAQNPQALLTQRIALMDEHSSEKGAALRRRVHAAVRPEAFAKQDPARCAELIQRFVKQGTWHTPTLHIVAFRSLRFYERPEWKDALRYLPASLVQTWRDRLIDYTDPTHYTEWKDQGDWALEVIGQMHRAGVRLMVGTDAPGLVFMPGFTLHDELDALARAGLPPVAVLRAATLTPAQFFRAEANIGTLEAGKLADIVLLDANPLTDIQNARRINTVISKGRVYDRATLDAMLRRFDSTRH